ncbi:MAG: PqqD family protein [Candidatus Cloacimonetes bacterium]|nr:PqqD family protein [Candidatus Cloacimonadota bacterium]
MNTSKLKKIAISESGFIFDPSTGISYNSNEMAITIINLLNKDRSEEEIIAKIMEEYEVTHDAIRRDLEYFLTQLKNLHLVS